MAVVTAAFPSPPGTRSTYFTASPRSTLPRVGNSVWQTPNTPLGKRRPALGATSAGREQWNPLPTLPFAGETLLPWDVVRRPSSNLGPTGDKLPTETHPEELQPWGRTRNAPRANQSPSFRKPFFSGTPPGTHFIGPDAHSGGAHERMSGNEREVA